MCGSDEAEFFFDGIYDSSAVIDLVSHDAYIA